MVVAIVQKVSGAWLYLLIQFAQITSFFVNKHKADNMVHLSTSNKLAKRIVEAF